MYSKTINNGKNERPCSFVLARVSIYIILYYIYIYIHLYIIHTHIYIYLCKQMLWFLSIDGLTCDVDCPSRGRWWRRRRTNKQNERIREKTTYRLYTCMLSLHSSAEARRDSFLANNHHWKKKNRTVTSNWCIRFPF